MRLYDTVAAVATPHGKGGVAMIRISGSDALAIGDKIFGRKNGKKLSEAESAKMVYGEIIDPTCGESVDDGMAAVFRAPHSFTGENTVELYCHGGSFVTRKILAIALASGARMAEAGEFTRRAFVNGKLGLAEAEALGALLSAGSDTQLRLAHGGLKGHLAQKTREVYEGLKQITAGIYAAIDFPDEDLNEYSRDEIRAVVAASAQAVGKLIATYGTGHAIAEGVPTVICGRANVGKSSVYNRIVGYDAAIVTDIQGTTRDVLRERATLGSVTLELCDTAGLRKTEDAVENIGIGRALEALDGAELVLAVFDGSAELDSDDGLLIERLKGAGKSCVALLNKSDLGVLPQTRERVLEAFESCVELSADTGEGFAELSGAVEALYIDGSIDTANDAVVTGARQYAVLASAREALGEALSALDGGAALDLCSVGIEAAMSALAEVDGREISEEIVAEIFSKFCVGK